MITYPMLKTLGQVLKYDINKGSKMELSNGYKTYERRIIDDRRNVPTPLFNPYLFRGKRQKVRRLKDIKGIYYVDRFNRNEYVAVLLLIFLCMGDAALTIFYLSKGFEEFNPLLNSSLAYGGIKWFLFVKFGLTIPCLSFLFLHSKNPIARKGLWFLAIIYSLLMIYHFAPILFEFA